MVTMPTATGLVGGSALKRRLREKKIPVAKEKAAIQRKAAAMRLERVDRVIGSECIRSQDEAVGSIEGPRRRPSPSPSPGLGSRVYFWCSPSTARAVKTWHAHRLGRPGTRPA